MRRIALRHLSKVILAGLLLFPLAASSAAHDRFGGRRAIIVPHYSYIYPYRTWGWGWDWGFGNPYWGYAPYYRETTGKVKIEDHTKSDEVYINGAYAGTAGKMKTIKLDPGTYNIKIQRQGTELLNKRIYVIAGKTVEIDVNGS